MKGYNEYKELLYLMCWDVKNSYRWEMSQKVPLDSFECEGNILIFDGSLVNNYNKNCCKGHIFEVGVKHPKQLHDSHY